MAENVREVCTDFVPQQWRKTKCQTCFREDLEHDNTKDSNKNLKESYIRTDYIKIKETSTESVSSSTPKKQQNQPVVTVFSKETEKIKVVEKIDIRKKSKSISEGQCEKVTSSPVTTPNEPTTGEVSWNEEETRTPPRSSSVVQKRRTRSHRKNSSNLLQLSAMMRSSNSSICSFTSEQTDCYSDYDYDIPSVTDDTDDYAEIQDVIEELHPDIIKERMITERKMSRSKIFDLERELEGQQDHHRASEVAKDRQIKSLIREIEGLKLELSSVRAHENMFALKCRLDQEGKSHRIEELEEQVQSLQDEVSKLAHTSDSTDTHYEQLHKELERSQQRVAHLEEENRTAEARLKLAEDLQQNDRELLDVLRYQVSQIEEELQSAHQCNRAQEDQLKLMEALKNDFLNEQNLVLKFTKESDSLRQKIKRRDRHIGDLEDDNVKLQQMKTTLDAQLAKKESHIQKIERKLSNLQDDVSRKNREISDLTGEKRTLEQVRRLTDLQLQERKMSAPEICDGENIFISSLEERLTHSESRVKELELENENCVKEIKDCFDHVMSLEQRNEDYKSQMSELDNTNLKFRQENKHYEKKLEALHRKLKKVEKEKQRVISQQKDVELQLAVLQHTEEMDKCGECGESSPMLRLKLQSIEAKLVMIESNKGHLEAKVKMLERKLRDRESELQRLQESLERDSGVTTVSHDLDRLDTLERENILLHTRLEEAEHEASEKTNRLDQQEEMNAQLHATVGGLQVKLEECNGRLKDLEHTNHELGRQALRLSGEQDINHSIEMLKSENNSLKEKMQQFANVEELVELLEAQLSKEKYTKERYNQQMEQMHETIRLQEERNQEYGKEIYQINLANHDLQNDVKRLEQKLEIYSDLFGENSSLRNALKRQSFQTESHANEELLIENALAPLMEEIKEKDDTIKQLQTNLREKESSVNALTAEVDLLETNLVAMVSEKLKGVNPLEAKEEEQKRDELLIYEQYRNIPTAAEGSEKDGKWLPENINTSGGGEKESAEKLLSDEKDLTVTTAEFYNLLEKHTEQLQQKDASYRNSLESHASSSNRSSRISPNRCSFDFPEPPNSSVYAANHDPSEKLVVDMYETIAQLEDLVNQNKNRSGSRSISPRQNSNTSRETSPRNTTENITTQQQTTCTQLRSAHSSPRQTSSVIASSLVRSSSCASSFRSFKNNNSPRHTTTLGKSASGHIAVKTTDTSPRQTTSVTEVLRTNNSPRSTTTDISTGSSNRNLSSESSIDLSGLDDLLEEVSHRNNTPNTVSRSNSVKSERSARVPSLRRRPSQPCPPSSDEQSNNQQKRVLVPSIITTKRRIIRLGEAKHTT